MAFPFAILGPAIGTLIDRLIPDKHEAEKAKLEMESQLAQASTQVNLEQIKTNQIEAEHRSIFVAGWRPAIGWACAFGFSWAFILRPVAEWVLLLIGNTTPMPGVDSAPLMEMAFAMLGLAGMRSWEKSRGLTK